MGTAITKEKREKHVISLVGYQGSGKTTIGKSLAARYGCSHLEMSEIVRAIHTGLSRDELPRTAEKTRTDPDWLAELVHKLILEESKNSVVVLTGVREPQIHKYLLAHDIQLHSFEIKAPAGLRYYRLLDLKKVSNAEQFLNHEVDETSMGLREVMDKARYAVITSEESSPRALAQAMKKRLVLKGVR